MRKKEGEGQKEREEEYGNFWILASGDSGSLGPGNWDLGVKIMAFGWIWLAGWLR